MADLFQVAAVGRSLMSVSRLAAAGCKVTPHGDKGDILHVSSGRRLSLVRRNGVYALELRVCSKGGGAPGRRQPASVYLFPGQGR